MTATDEELMVAFCATRDKAVFSELISRTEEMVRRVLSKYGETHVDDFVQETYLSVFTNPDRYCSRNNFRGWLVTLALNVAGMHFRKLNTEKRDRKLEKRLTFELNSLPTPDPIAQQADNDFLRDLVRRLPPDQRAMVEGVYLSQKTWKEAAADAGIPIGTAHHVLNRGLERLRERLTAEADSPAA